MSTYWSRLFRWVFTLWTLSSVVFFLMFAGLDRIWARKSGNQAPLAEKSGILQGFAEKQPEMRTNEKMKKKQLQSSRI